MDLPFHIEGIPCIIHITHFRKVEGDMNADNDLDYNGYTDIEFRIKDRKGYNADWLEKKITPALRLEIEDTICKAYNTENL